MKINDCNHKHDLFVYSLLYLCLKCQTLPRSCCNPGCAPSGSLQWVHVVLQLRLAVFIVIVEMAWAIRSIGVVRFDFRWCFCGVLSEAWKFWDVIWMHLWLYCMPCLHLKSDQMTKELFEIRRRYVIFYRYFELWLLTFPLFVFFNAYFFRQGVIYRQQWRQDLFL